MVLDSFITETNKIIKQYNDIYFNYLFIDDGSTDLTLNKIKSFSELYTNINYISFSRNFGKESAILAGLKYSKADFVILMDADLEHPPQLIHDFLKYHHKYDSVIAVRTSRKDSFFSDSFVKIINLVSKNIHLQKGMVDYRIINRKVIDSILSIKEIERYSRGLFDWVGFSKKYIEYKNVKQNIRKSHWNFKGLINYASSAIFSFSDLILNLIVGVGSFIFILSCLYACIALPLKKFSIYIYLILLMTSIIEISLGICSLYLKRIYWELKNRPIYIINESNIKEVV